MIRYVSGNLLDDDAEALVNPVNCVGAMGAGLAKQFKERFPLNFAHYKRACAAGKVKLGAMFLHENNSPVGPVWLINFPTKHHWKDNSRVEWIDFGLADMALLVRQIGVRSIALPMLGCGLGGLSFDDVRPLIERAFADLPDVDVRVYGPLADQIMGNFPAMG